jgi:hypothetical protein
MLQRFPRRWAASPIVVAISLCIALVWATAALAASNSQSANGNNGKSESAPGHAPATTTQTTTTTKHSLSGHGANHSGPYDANYTGAPSANGNSSVKSTGRPLAGSVGNADNKNPHGQYPNAATDGNNGYECDGNHGIARTNPAHTRSCQNAPTPGSPSVRGQTSSSPPPSETTSAPTVLGERTTSPGATQPVAAVRATTSAKSSPKATNLPFTGFAVLALAGIGTIAILLGMAGLRAVPRRG